MQILLYSTRTNWLLLLLTLLATPLHLFKLAIVITVLDVSRFCPPLLVLISSIIVVSLLSYILK